MGTPTITWANFRALLNDYIGDVPISATTDTAGAADYLSLIHI